jgi:hypothetical protein
MVLPQEEKTEIKMPRLQISQGKIQDQQEIHDQPTQTEPARKTEIQDKEDSLVGLEKQGHPLQDLQEIGQK